MEATKLERKRDRPIRLAITAAAAGLIVCAAWGCAPRGVHPELAAVRADYFRAQSDPAVLQSALVQLHEADGILSRAEEMWEQGASNNEVRQLAQQARSQVQVARSIAAYEQARLEIETRQEIDAAARRTAVEQVQRDSKPILRSSDSWNAPLDVRVHAGVDGTVDGTLVNTSQHPIADVLLMVNHAWLWRNEFRPGDDSPGRTEYIRVVEQIPPGGSVTFTHRPARPLPARNDGRFETSLEVVSFDEIR